ncbi:MAG TPA: FGGY-family carbohydrate kinase, partial [Solirubrobacteraceae bacterium]|nr:FGGY-family carbohydrate kinase [Solirubrobacteraceae bacterium]
AVGDMLAWFVSLLGGASYGELEASAAELRPGETGLLGFDWWNGNRSILADAELSGVLLGLTIQSSAAEIYRGLLESIAFGNRRIMDNFEEHGMPLDRIVACGGIAEKSPLTMQLVADTSGRTVAVPDADEVPARGAALFASVVGGVFPNIATAAAATRPTARRRYEPDPRAAAVYDRVYAIYREFYRSVGQDRSDWLHDLKRIRAEQLTQ